MIQVKLATVRDVQDLVAFGVKEKEENEVLPEIPVNFEDISYWFAECIMSGGNYVFIAKENEEICGFLVLTEMACPWNKNHTYLMDLMFLARKGGLKLIRTAKALAKKKKMKSVVLSVSSKKERSNKLLNHISQNLGGIYEIEVAQDE